MKLRLAVTSLCVLTIIALGSTCLLHAEEKKVAQPLVPTIEVPLNAGGSRLTFRFSVKNNGDAAVGVNDAFVNGTQLTVIYPDGTKKGVGLWKEGIIPEKLDKGETRNWTIDLKTVSEFAQKGTYTVYFTVNKVESNRVLVFVE